MKATLTRGGAAIVGVAESDLGEVAAGMSVIDLMAQGVQRALADCGLSLADVDGVFAAAGQSRMPTTALCEYLRLAPRYQDCTMMGGSSFMTHVAHAQAAIEAGLCEVAVIAYGSTQRSAGRKNTAPRELNPYETPYRPVTPATAYALAASRHMHQYGTDARAARADRGGGTPVGAAQSGRVGEDAAQRRAGARLANGELSPDGA